VVLVVVQREEREVLRVRVPPELAEHNQLVDQLVAVMRLSVRHSREVMVVLVSEVELVELVVQTVVVQEELVHLRHCNREVELVELDISEEEVELMVRVDTFLQPAAVVVHHILWQLVPRQVP
jgi:hypothetical protein